MLLTLMQAQGEEPPVEETLPSGGGMAGLVGFQRKRIFFSAPTTRSLYEIEEEEEFLVGIVEAAEEAVQATESGTAELDEGKAVLDEVRRLAVLDAVHKAYQGIYFDTFSALTAALKDRLDEIRRQKNLAMALLMIFAADE